VTDETVRDPGQPGEEGAGEPVGEIDEAIIETVSDYLDGVLTGPRRAEVADRISSDATWKRAHAELSETRRFLSGLQKAHAPSSFAEDVAQTIHQRSAGRFFARPTFGDRLPLGVLLVVALAGLAVIAYVLWSSPTGSLKVDHGRDRPPATGSAPVTPP
jgi:anti-sigma factor RsiW